MKVIEGKIIYEPGDFVVVHPKADEIMKSISFVNSMKIFLGKTVHINYVDKVSARISDGVYSWYFGMEAIRPATQEEITEYLENRLIVGDGSYLVEVKGEELYVGCQKIEKEQFIKIGKRMGWI